MTAGAIIPPVGLTIGFCIIKAPKVHILMRNGGLVFLTNLIVVIEDSPDDGTELLIRGKETEA